MRLREVEGREREEIKDLHKKNKKISEGLVVKKIIIG